MELWVSLPNGEMNRQIIGYAFEENKRLTRRDLERHALEVWCEGYEGVELAGSTEVLDTSRRPPAYVVADAYARLKDCQCYRIYANAARCDIGDAEEAESASDSELTKPQPYAKHAVSYLFCSSSVPSVLWQADKRAPESDS